MRKAILALVVLTGALAAALVLEQLFVEGSLGPAAMAATALLGLMFLALLATYLLAATRHKTLVANLWLAFFSVAATYVVLDLAAGWLLIRPLSPPLVPDAYRHHKLVPDSYAEFSQRDFHYVQRVNHHGLRGKEITTEKPPGTYRILMLGDSFTMGKGVEDDQTFSVVLQGSLNAAAAACGKPIEVINGGVDSYAPILSRIQLTRELYVLKPDLVVLNLDVSDLVQEAAYRHQAVRNASGDIEAVPQLDASESLIERVRIWTERRLFLTRVALFYATRALNFREVTVRDVVTRANAEIVAHTLADDVDRSQQWNDVFDSLEKIKDFTAASGMEFLLTVYPWPHQLNGTDWMPGRFAFMPEGARLSDKSLTSIRELSAARGISLLDVTPVFQAYGGAEPLYFKYDMHWTPAGHRVMAKAIEEYVMARFAPGWCRG